MIINTNKILIALFIFSVFIYPIYADTSTWTAFGSGAGVGTSATNIHISSLGILGAGKSSNSNYQNISGFLAAFAAGQDASGPEIKDFKVDGREVRAGDYIASAGRITANVTDPSGVNLTTSNVGFDTTKTAFSGLSGDSSYNAASGDLINKLNITTDGDHTLSLYAVDTAGNISSYEVAVKVDTGDVKASNVYAHPNPYNPNNGNLRLAYMLSKDATISIYIFNAINQPIWKRDYSTGTEGGHAGYNEVLWNGISDFGEVAGNDIYFARLVADGKRVIGRVKIAVVK